MINAAWCETYWDFVTWLEEAGIDTDSLPSWHGSVPVRILAMPGRLYLERVSRREYSDFQRMAARGELRLRALPLARLQELHTVHIASVDLEKMLAWKTNNERCN